MKRTLLLLVACVLVHLPALLSAQVARDTVKTIADTADTGASDFIGFNAPEKAAFKSNVFKTSPVPIFIMGQIPICGELRLTYERVLNARHSIVIGGSYNYPSLILLAASVYDTSQTKITDYSIRGGRVMLGYRYYVLKKLRKEAPHGLFVGPYISYNVVKIKEKGGNGSSETIHYFNACAIAGYQLVSKSGFSFEVFTGLGYRNNFLTTYDARINRTTKQSFNFLKVPDELPGLKYVKFCLQVNLGYAF